MCEDVSKSQRNLYQKRKGIQGQQLQSRYKTPASILQNRALLWWCSGSGDQHLNSKPSRATPRPRGVGPCNNAGIGHGARTPAAAGGTRSVLPTGDHASRTRPPDTGLYYDLRVLRYSKINGSIGENWIVDRDVALQYEFLLWPCAPGDVGRVAVNLRWMRIVSPK